MDSAEFLVASNGDVRVSVVKCGHIDTNTGFIENLKLREAALIDAPFGAFEASKGILSRGTKIVAVLFTHGHWDHIGDGHIFRELGAKTYAHRFDRPLIEHPETMAALVGLENEIIPCQVDAEVGDGETIGGWLDISCSWVPGHSPGDLSFYAKSLGCVFVGDTLFRGGIGRSDLPGGNGELLISGIREKILSLPDSTTVIPGHGSCTTVAKEKIHNTYLC